MDKRTLANRLVADFGKVLTLPTLILDDASDRCVLVFDSDLVLNIEYDDPAERLVFSICLDPLPSHGAEALLRELMGANLFWHRTHGATLCLDEATNGVILVYARNVTEFDGPTFETLVENLLNQAEKWRALIKTFDRPEMSSMPPIAESGGLPPLYG